jgi:sugar phosphate permease
MVSQDFMLAKKAHAAELPTRARWTQLAPTLLMLWIVSTFDKSNISLVIADPAFLKEMNLTGQHVLLGWLASGLFLAYGIAAPFWGWFIDRSGPRRAAIVSLIIWALTCFAAGFASSYATLLLSRVILGAGEAAMYPLTVALVAKWFPLKERGKATASWWIGTMIGPMFVGLIVTALILTVGWRWQFHALGILALLLPLPMVVLLVRDKPEDSNAVNVAEAQLIAAGSIEKNEEAPGRILREGSGNVWLNYRFWLVVTAISANSLFWWGWSTWLPTYLRTARHFSFSNSGYLTFVIYGFAVATILIFGKISDDVFRRAPFAGLGWILGAVFLVAAALAPNAILSVVLIILALCSQQVGILCAETVVHSVVGTADMAKTQGVRAFVSSIVGALSPALIGYILSLTGGFAGVFVVLTLAVVIAGGCMFTLARDGL